MTKKNFRANWEQVFVGYNDAELYALSVWIHQMKAKNHWRQARRGTGCYEGCRLWWF